MGEIRALAGRAYVRDVALVLPGVVGSVTLLVVKTVSRPRESGVNPELARSGEESTARRQRQDHWREWRWEGFCGMDGSSKSENLPTQRL